MANIPVTWRDGQTANTTTSGNQFKPDILQLGNGNILVTWTSNDDTGAGAPAGSDVIGRLFDPLGNAIGDEFLINNAASANTEGAVSTGSHGSGSIMAVYEEQGPSGNSIWLDRFGTGNVPQAADNEVAIAGFGTPDYFAPQIAIAASGTSAVVIYESSTAGISTIVGRRYDILANALGTQTTIFSGGDHAAPQIAELTNGTYVVAAQRLDTDNKIAYRLLDSSGVGLTAASFVNQTATNGEDDHDVAVAALTGGGFVISWVNTDAQDTDVKFRVFDSAGTQIAAGEAGMTPSANTSNNIKPSVAGLADGSFIVTVDNQELGQLDATHVSAAGTVLGTYSFAGNGSQIAVSALEDGRFAAVWRTVGGEISFEIMDTRDAVNATPVFSGLGWQIGLATADVFTVGSLVGTVHGWTGDDIITTNGGSAVFGDDGNDKINVSGFNSTQSFDGGDGVDLLDATLASFLGGTFDLGAGTLTVGVSTIDITNFENANGTASVDTLTGTDGDNVIDGKGSNDTLYGGLGADYLIGNTGNDTLSGDVGSANTMQGGVGDDTYCPSSEHLAQLAA